MTQTRQDRELPLPLQIAWRFLSGRRSGLLNRTANAALISLAVGVAAMVVAMALMRGYRTDLEAKLVAGNAPVVLYPLRTDSSVTRPEDLAVISRLPDVRAVAPVAYAQGTLSSGSAAEGELVTIRGVTPGGDHLGGTEEQLEISPGGLPGVILGHELLVALDVTSGDVVQLMALGLEGGRARFRYRTLEVRGTFSTGFAEFDRRWMVVERSVVEALTGGENGTLYEISLDDPANAPRVSVLLEESLGDRFLVVHWQELNRELFAALKLQQLALFFVLGLIVVVSTFNVSSTLMVLVRERMRELGLLSALGFSRRRTVAVFLLYGAFVGGVGTMLGALFGSALSWIISTFELIRFDPEVAEIYFLSSVPFRVSLGDLLAVVAFSLSVTMISCLIPAWRAGRLDPAPALRYE